MLVTVVPAPVELQLAFVPPTLTVVAGATTTAMLSLPDVPAGATVTVTLSSLDATTAKVRPVSVMFTATTPSHVVTVTGVGAGSARLSADAQTSFGLPPDSSVIFAELSVTVVPAPVHLALAFEPMSLTVRGGCHDGSGVAPSGCAGGFCGAGGHERGGCSGAGAACLCEAWVYPTT